MAGKAACSTLDANTPRNAIVAQTLYLYCREVRLHDYREEVLEHQDSLALDILTTSYTYTS